MNTEKLNDFLLARLVDLLLDELPDNGERETWLDSFFLVRRNDPQFCWQGVLRPMAALVCQGAKIFQRNQKREIANPGDIILNVVDIPDTVGLRGVDSDKPYLCVYFMLNRKIFMELLGEMPSLSRSSGNESASRFIFHASAEFLEAMLRASQVALNGQDSRILGGMLLKELHYLLLKSPCGDLIRQLFMQGSNDSRIVDAINFLRQNVARPVSMEELAHSVFMSISSLHRHFKKVTGFSPLQYHKELRLHEAQRLMLVENERADHAAIAVGYESVTQFNREYKRKFGLPPHKDIKARREGLDFCAKS